MAANMTVRVTKNEMSSSKTGSGGSLMFEGGSICQVDSFVTTMTKSDVLLCEKNASAPKKTRTKSEPLS